MTRTQIALAVAGLLLGAQAGVAALNESAEAVAAPRTEAVETQQIPEAAQAVGAVADAQAEPAVAVPAVTEHVFPMAASDRTMLPSRLAYLERTAVAQGPILAASFPGSADERDMLPARVAYFDARNAPVVAAAEPAVVAAVALP